MQDASPMPAPARPPLPNPRLALVGCGSVGHLHRERLLAENVAITAICDPDSDALARMAETLPKRPRLYRSEVDLLRDGEADAVVLCTPHGLHGSQTRACLEAGVHVLCEKPFVTDAVEGAELVNLARGKNLALFVSYTRRSRGHARFLTEAAAQIGPLQHVLVTRAQPWFQQHYHTWRMHSAEGGGFLLDAGASMLDLLLRLTDNARVTYRVVELLNRGTVDADIRASLLLEFAGGVHADISLLGDAAEEVERIELFGQRGTAGWSLREGEPSLLYRRSLGGKTEVLSGSPFRVPLPDAAFVAALRVGGDFTQADPTHSAASALPTIALVQSLYARAHWRTLTD